MCHHKSIFNSCWIAWLSTLKPCSSILLKALLAILREHWTIWLSVTVTDKLTGGIREVWFWEKQGTTARSYWGRLGRCSYNHLQTMAVAKEINDARPHCIVTRTTKKRQRSWVSGKHHFIFTRSLSPNSNHEHEQMICINSEPSHQYEALVRWLIQSSSKFPYIF